MAQSAWSNPIPAAGECYAILVAVQQYDRNQLRDLQFAENDMKAMAELLRAQGYRRVVLLTQTEGARQARFLPTAENIRRSLKGLAEDRDPQDTLLVAFAGHGVQFRGSDESFFCPMDARLEDQRTLLALSEVYRELEGSKAGFKLLLVDACRNDPQSDHSRSRTTVRLESVTRPQRTQPPGGVAAFFSCSAGERAFENPTIRHGIFFHYVTQGLNGKADLNKDGAVDLDELVLYTRRQVPDFVKDEYGDDVRQMPELVSKTRGVPVLARTVPSSLLPPRPSIVLSPSLDVKNQPANTYNNTYNQNLDRKKEEADRKDLLRLEDSKLKEVEQLKLRELELKEKTGKN
jgi:hypothetical protein